MLMCLGVRVFRLLRVFRGVRGVDDNLIKP